MVKPGEPYRPFRRSRRCKLPGTRFTVCCTPRKRPPPFEVRARCSSDPSNPYGAHRNVRDTVESPLRPFADVMQKRSSQQVRIFVSSLDEPPRSGGTMHHVARVLVAKEFEQSRVQIGLCQREVRWCRHLRSLSELS